VIAFTKKKPLSVKFDIVYESYDKNFNATAYEKTIQTTSELAISALDEFANNMAKKRNIKEFKSIWEFKEIGTICKSHLGLEEEILHRDDEGSALKVFLHLKVDVKLELSMLSGEKSSGRREMEVEKWVDLYSILKALNLNLSEYKLLLESLLFFEISSSGWRADMRKSQIYRGGPTILVQEDYVILKVKGKRGQIKSSVKSTLLDCYKNVANDLGIEVSENLSGIYAVTASVIEGNKILKTIDVENFKN
jgi:hypothetical protein